MGAEYSQQVGVKNAALAHYPEHTHTPSGITAVSSDYRAQAQSRNGEKDLNTAILGPQSGMSVLKHRGRYLWGISIDSKTIEFPWACEKHF